MDTRLYTDSELDALRDMPKHVENPKARWADKPTSRPGHRQRTFRASASGEGDFEFIVFQRTSLSDQHDFSCGLVWTPRNGPRLPLARYNGPGHEHGDIFFRPHIHLASARAIKDGRKPDSEAEETKRFETVEGALACLISDCAVTGLSAEPDQPRLI